MLSILEGSTVGEAGPTTISTAHMTIKQKCFHSETLTYPLWTNEPATAATVHKAFQNLHLPHSPGSDSTSSTKGKVTSLLAVLNNYHYTLTYRNIHSTTNSAGSCLRSWAPEAAVPIDSRVKIPSCTAGKKRFTVWHRNCSCVWAEWLLRVRSDPESPICD